MLDLFLVDGNQLSVDNHILEKETGEITHGRGRSAALVHIAHPNMKVKGSHPPEGTAAATPEGAAAAPTGSAKEAAAFAAARAREKQKKRKGRSARRSHTPVRPPKKPKQSPGPGDRSRGGLRVARVCLDDNSITVIHIWRQSCPALARAFFDFEQRRKKKRQNSFLIYI